MFIFRTGNQLRHYLSNSDAKVHFVPTMGALHQGHLNLISEAKEEKALVVCSIFVNPTQFNDPKDLDKYPNSIEEDILLLEAAQCDVLFLPQTSEIYPDGMEYQTTIDLNGIDEVLEGALRPGHFKGVIQVVEKLLELVRPEKIFMGQKDYQQQLIITALLAQRFPHTELIRVPTAREKDGLAMSSRNIRLDPMMRTNAPALYKAISKIAAALPTENTEPLLLIAREEIETAGLIPEYLEIRDAVTLALKTRVTEDEQVVIFVAAKAGEVRLIDNILWPDCNF